MKALRFHYDLPRLAATKMLGAVSASAYVGPLAPVRLDEIDEPRLPADDWVRVRTELAGVCGSDVKEVMLNGAWDNPLTSLISFPHVLGHEATGVVEDVGAAVTRHARGDRVVLNPWLACAQRGVEPPCDACRAGDYTLCRNFDAGRLPAGMHIGNNAGVPGAFARSFVAHESQLLPVPATVGTETAVLADPFSVSLHSVLRRPPRDGEPVLVYGLGTLGLCAIAALRRLCPDSAVLAVGRYPQQIRLAEHFGASEVITGGPEEIIARVAELTGARLLRPWKGLPWMLDGVAVVYDTVGSPESVEVAVRLVRSRGSVVVSGVEVAKRFEWTPIYFKEIDVTGSNAFAVEEIDGVRKHAMEWYLDFCGDGLDISALVTHRFALSHWRDAFSALMSKSESGAVKVVLEPDLD